jgi:hypothetical protein
LRPSVPWMFEFCFADNDQSAYFGSWKHKAMTQVWCLCIIDGINEKELSVLTDIGDIIIEHRSGGNSTEILLASKKEKHMIKIRN